MDASSIRAVPRLIAGKEVWGTLTCIAGSMVEAMYGVPAIYEAECKSRLPEDMQAVLERFDAARGRSFRRSLREACES